MKRWLIIIIGCVMVVGAGWAVYDFLREEPVSPTQDNNGQVTEFAKPKLVGWSKGKRQWTVEAHSMNDAGNTVTLEGIEHGVIYKDGKEYFNFKANRGVWQKASESQGGGNLDLSGAIEVFKGKDLLFKTDQLTWQGANQVLVAPQPVSFSYDGNHATATQMTFSAATEDLTLADDIQFTMKDGTRATIKGELFYNLKTKVFQVRGDQQFEFGM